MTLLRLMQRAILALCLATCSTSCLSTASRGWIFLEVKASHPCYNAGKIILKPEKEYSYLEVEIVRTSSGLRMYLNILLMQALPCQDNIKATEVVIILPQETLTFIATLLEGGQRILFPPEITNLLIQTLLNDLTFSIKLGANSFTVIPNQFEESYSHLMQISIEQNSNFKR